LKKFGTFIKRLAQNRKAIWSKVKEHRYGFDLFWVVPKSLHGRTQTAWGTRGSLWPDLILVGLPLLVLALVIRAQVLNERVVQRVALKPGVTLPAFSAIDTEKLTTRSVINRPGSFASIDDLRRRYPIKDLVSDELVNEQQLLPTRMSYLLAGRSLATLPISGSIGASIQPMQRVKLILASREKEKPGVVIEDVILLAAQKQGDSTFVTVALTGEAVNSIQSLAGLSNVFVLEKLD
jgi:hypothetical protein